MNHLLAAAPDAVAPIKAAVLAFLSFLVLLMLAFTDTGSAKSDGPDVLPADQTDQPIEDQVGT